MDKLNMQTKNLTNEKFEILKELFPNAITESINDDGELVRAVDKDALELEISTNVVGGGIERYQFTWPEKRKAILNANAPISKTLRPCREESLNFDETENLYIEGDNLEVLKLLQETYLGKVKMIYIDPPYNTGSDFVYNDDFKESTDEYLKASGQFDEDGNRLDKNLESNGRFHTDWLNMIYPRLKLARNLLSDDGVIFISIDDNEQANLKKVCDEIFGQINFVANFIRKTSYGEKTAKPKINKHHEYILCYVKDIITVTSRDILKGEEKIFEEYQNPDNDPKGEWKKDSYLIKIDEGRYGYARYPIHNPYLDITHYPPVHYNENNRKQWHYIKETFDKKLKEGEVVFYKNEEEYTGEYSFFIKKYKSTITDRFKNISSLEYSGNDFVNSKGTEIMNELFSNENPFVNSYPKPVNLIKLITKYIYDKKSIIMDFFSGSATTAHAVMELNAEDGGNRKFIMVQLPEDTDEKSEAYKAGYKNICEIGKERIRRAGKKILEDNKDKDGIENLDIGFRVLKTDTSNMKDVYYRPGELNQNFLDTLTDNIKEDRTGEDLLFQVMLDLGIPLSSKIETEDIDGKEIFIVDDGYLIASFDRDIDDNLVTKIAEREPAFAVFRDSSMKSDSALNNFDQIFERLSPETTRRVI